MQKRVNLGDILEIKTKRGFAYCQITHKHKIYGSLIRALPGFYQKAPEDFLKLACQPDLFRTFFPVEAAVNRNIFRVVANHRVPDFAQEFPVFRAGVLDPATKRVKTWWLWDGEREWPVGKLTPEQRKYPIRGVWNDTLLIERLEKEWRVETAEW